MKKFFIAFAMLLCFCSALTFSACNETQDNSLYENKILELEQRIEELESTAPSDDISELKQQILSLQDSVASPSEIEAIIAELEKIENTLCREYETIKLTSANYAQYLAVNITYSNCIAILRDEDSLGVPLYDLSCIVTITTSAATDCRFQYIGKPVSIFYNQPNISGWNTDITGATANIDYKGNSSVSFSIWKTKATNPGFPTLHEYDITVSSIYGNVLVPKEA